MENNNVWQLCGDAYVPVLWSYVESRYTWLSRNPKVHYRLFVSPPLVPILSKVYPVHRIVTQLLQINYSNILLSVPQAPLKTSFPHEFPVELYAFVECPYVCSFFKFPSLHLRHSSFSNPSVGLPMSQLILQPFRCFTYVTAHSPTLLSLLLRHRLFTYVTWRAAHGPAHFNHLDLRFIIKLDEEYYTCSSALCNFLHSPLI